MSLYSSQVSNLLRPFSLHQFLYQCWERDLLILTGEVSRLEGLLNIADVEHLAYSLAMCDRDWLRLIKNGKELPEAAYETSERMVDLTKVWRAYSEGFTVQLSKIHKRWPPITRLCRQLEIDLTRSGVALRSRIGAHLYLTPAGSQGFDLHYDDHDVFILQLQGRKHWRVHDFTGNYPIARKAHGSVREPLPPLKLDTIIEPGDVLYIPRGVYHEARAAAEEFSLHVTIGIYPATWVDLLGKLLGVSPELGQPLPFSEADMSDDAHNQVLLADLRERLAALASPQAVLAARASLAESFLSSIDAIPSCGFIEWNAKAKVDPASVLERRAGMLGVCIVVNDTATLSFQGASIRGPKLLVPLLEFLASVSGRFTASDLPTTIPMATKIELLEQLVQDGYLISGA